DLERGDDARFPWLPAGGARSGGRDRDGSGAWSAHPRPERQRWHQRCRPGNCRHYFARLDLLAGLSAVRRMPDHTMAPIISAPPIRARLLGYCANRTAAKKMAYTGSRAMTMPALRAFSVIRLDTSK